jgi:ribosomal protein L37AE/L43A
MSSPLCPNCQEHMSSVEHGQGGVWSCLYCEGNWLPQAHALQVLSVLELQPARSGETVATLVCPSCNSRTFSPLSAPNSRVFQCATCQSLYFESAALAALAPQVFLASAEAPVLAAIAGTVAAVLLFDPMALAVALVPKKVK